jgi:multidrug efflux pump subunit AcrA (membrane-fusion protein)
VIALPRNKKIIILFACGMLFLFLLVYRLLLYRAAVEVVMVKKAEIQGIVHGPGTVQSRVPVTVSTKITGILERLYADQGDLVTQGQLLAELDVQEIQARVASSRAALTRFERDLDRAQATVAKTQANLTLAQSDHRRYLDIFKNGVISEATMDTTSAALQVAESEYAEAQAGLTALEAAKAQAASEVRVAEANLGYTRIAAPMDGLITVRKAEVGNTVTPGTPIFQMVDLTTIWVAAWIDETQIAHLREGQRASITLRSGRVFEGEVVRLNKQADTVTRELEVDVQFKTLPNPLVIGEEAEVNIATQKQTALVAPLSAVFLWKGETGVLTVNNSRAAFYPVSLGVQDLRNVAVSSGLQEGDLVILHPGGSLVERNFRPVIKPDASREDK